MAKPKIIIKIENLRKRKEKLCEYITYCKRMANSVSSPSFDAEVVSGTRSFEAPFVKWIEKQDDAERELKKVEEQLSKEGIALLELAKYFENQEECFILSYRYHLGMSWLDIEKQVHLSQATVYRYHRNGLNKLLEIEAKKMIVNDSSVIDTNKK